MKFRNGLMLFYAALTGLTACHLAVESDDVESAPKSIEVPYSEPLAIVTVLGSGTPVPSKTQRGPSLLIQIGAENLLFDCGRGCTSRIEQLDPALITQIDKVFFTHMHSDHISGFPDLWLNGWAQGRNAPLRVWGPKGVDGMIDGLSNAYESDIYHRTKNRGPSAKAGIAKDVTELDAESEVVWEKDDIKVWAFTVNHAGMPAYGYRIDIGEKSLLISGDTTVADNLVTYGQGVDVMMLEVLSPAMISYLTNNFEPKFTQAVIGLHLTAGQASDVFDASSPKLGVYYHTVANCQTDPSLLKATALGYDGDVVVSRDLMQFHISNDDVTLHHKGTDPYPCPE